MTNLISEQLPNDGGFYLHTLMSEINQELDKFGEHGKTCKLKKTGNSITLQFYWQGGQRNKGCKCNFTKQGIEKAAKIARQVTSQLMANSFSFEWYDRLLGKEIKSPIDNRTTREASDLLSEYKAYWYREHSDLKSPDRQWYAAYGHLESITANCTQCFDESILRQTIERSSPNSSARNYLLNGLKNFCDYFSLNQFFKIIEQYKKNNKPKHRCKHIPDDLEIEYLYFNGFKPKIYAKKSLLERYPQWQFLYGLLAVYGLRVHELWNIANWDTPVTVKKGDWIVVEITESDDSSDDISEQYGGNNFIVPAILDSQNEQKILCVKHDTKTGYRMALPLFPNGENWLEKFNLIQPLNLPYYPDPFKPTGKCKRPYCSMAVSRWFRLHKYGFTPHALRHAYNHRGHSQGINPTILSQSLGHSLMMNGSTYLKTMPESRKWENFKNVMETQAKERNKMSELEQEIEKLKKENEILKLQNQLLKQEMSGKV
jgi:integrase